MKVIIIEDERLAAEQLEFLLKRYDHRIEVLASLASVKSAIEWFTEHDHPDLAFFDIQLTDGSSFEVIEQIKVKCPIIFATAYQEYMLQAFKTNGIAYILKPYDWEEIQEAMEKYKQLELTFSQEKNPNLKILQQALNSLQKNYKERFLVKSGSQLMAIPASEVSFFFHESKVVWLKTKQNKKFAVDYTLDQLESTLDPKAFYRINRKYILSFSSIQKIQAFSSNRLKIQTLHGEKDDIVVSRDRVSGFKEWMDG